MDSSEEARVDFCQAAEAHIRRLARELIKGDRCVHSTSLSAIVHKKRFTLSSLRIRSDADKVADIKICLYPLMNKFWRKQQPDNNESQLRDLCTKLGYVMQDQAKDHGEVSLRVRNLAELRTRLAVADMKQRVTDMEAKMAALMQG